MAFATAYLQIILLALLNTGADILDSPQLTPHLMVIPREQLILRYEYGVAPTPQKRRKAEILATFIRSLATK
jgi:hypothetical protein